MPIESLKGLKGLSGLSQQERDAWRRVNASKLEGKSAQYEDRLYANQQFVKKFGMDAFKSYNKDQRDYIYKNALVNEAFTSAFSPYTNKRGADGKFTIDPNKGMGNAEEFQKYFAMDADSKLELLESGWKTTPQIESMLKEEHKKKQDYINNSSAWAGASPWAQSAVAFATSMSEPIHEELSRSKNNKILEGIYARDLKKREAELQPEIDDYYINTIGELSDSEVKSQFMKAITPSKSNIGNGQLAAFFHDGKNIESEVKNFSIDDMRMYLAKSKVLTDNLGVGAAHDALNNYAKEYINNHQSKLTYAGLLAKDIGISALSYTADKINSIRQLYDLTQGESVVWIDNKGNVVAPNQVKTSSNGSKYYINEDGEATSIKQTKMSIADLDYLGKDANGNTRDAMWNNQFWSDAEQYGTLNWDEQRQYKKLGASPYKVVYKPGDDSDLLYETIKMTSFGIADAASMAIPVFGETVGSAMQVTKAASMLNKAANVVGKGIYYTSKATKAVQPTIGATAIGHAYGRGVFGEALAQNMQQLEESTYTHAQKNFLDNYKSNKQFKAQVDRDIQAEFNRLKNAQIKELKASEGSKKIVDQDLNNKVLMEKARQIVSSAYVDRGSKEIQSSDAYFDMVGKASESASDAAMTAAITDGAKYAIVNNFGYRKFLFNTAADRAASAAKRLTKNISENEGRLSFKSLIDGRKLRTIGKITASQAWGGAWTNFTDEMQSWGGKQINQDRFSSYLNGFYNGQASDDTYGAMDAVASYFNGAMASLAKGTTWNAGLVGATGSLTSFAPNITSVATTISTKRGREAWRKASLGEKANMIFSNGVLNEYYGKKQGEAEIKEYVDAVNKLLDEQDNFSILKDAVALDRASIDVENQEDKNALTYLRGIKAISLLHQFQDDSGMKDQSDSRVKKWLKNRFGSDENTLGAVASQSTILTKALSEIEDLANGNLDEETAKSYLSEYYAKNPTIEQSEETSRQALEEMSQNARTLQEAEDTWQDINSKLDTVERDRGSKISPIVRSKLLERAALDDFISERLDALEDKISGNRINISNESTAETWGTKEAIKKQVLAMERTERDLNKAINTAKDKLDDVTTKLKDYEESHDIENLDDIATIEHQGLLNDVEAAKLQHEYTINAMDKLKSRQEKMRAMSEEETSRVLSKDEILALPSESRARMLSDVNRSNYSKEQLEQIDALKNELTLKDPSLLQSIQDQARLLKQKNANANAYEMILNNPEAAATEFEAQSGVDATIARDLAFRRYGESINNIIRKLNSLEGVGQDDIRESVYKNLRVLNPNILDYLDATIPNEEGLEFIPSYSNEITRAKEWSNMLTDISKAIDQMNFDDSTKKIFSDNIDSLIDKASTKKQAMDILEQVSNSTDVSNSDQANFKRLLNIINGVEEQRNATTTETQEEKKARQESQETQAKQEEKKVQDAENKVQEAIEVTDKEAANDKYAEEHKEEAINGEDVDLGLESPALDQQISSAESKQDSPIINTTEVKPDVTDQGNNFTSTSENMLGNAMYGYDVKALEEDAKEVERTGKDPNDKMSRFFNWFKTANIKLQEIVDNELKDVVKANNKLEILYVNPQTNATDDAALNDFSLLCVEYTDAVKRVHNEDRGGTITANGKQYLIVGTTGFDRTNPAQGNTYRNILYQGKKNRYKYFTENPSERFYIDPSGHTEVEQMTSGRIVREMIGDTETKIRPITELLSDPNRNPKGLKLQDLKWGIQYDTRFATVGVSERNTVYPPRDASSNKGAVFLLIEAANGNYIPAAIVPTMLSDLQEGALKTQMNNLFNELSSIKHSERLAAINKLVQILNIDKDGDNILIGTEDKATVSTVKNGTVIRTFNLEDANFNRMDLINAIFELNPRINITLSTLSDPVQLRMYAEAGALNTDIAKLGTSNASYTVYSMDANGNPIKTKPIENGTPNLDANSDLDKADYKKKHSIYHRGIQYREKNGKWYDTNWKEITDPTLLNQIKWASYIRANDLTPSLISNDVYGNKNNKYYIINSDNTNAKVIKVFESGAIAELNIADSRTVINIVQQRDIQAAREKAAREEKQRLENIENSMTPDKVEMTAEGENVNLTDEQITAQESGDFSSEAKPQPTDTELRAQAIVDRITTDTHDITLDNKKGVYTDSTGKEYARVTSVIQATEGTERFDPNSPWILPSTNIGTGIDNFVRDFFANKLGNLDSLHERYPNASTHQLQAFEKQLRELKANFDKKGLTVVPRDVTVTGEIEVTDANGKKYKLSVAGTLDLLAYDKDGNFYIFDMKTNHSAPNAKKAAKWNKQLSLYKQFLETKYGVSVKGTSIIPIEVSYPTPKGWREGKTIYRADEKTNQLYYQTDYGTSTLAPETAFMDSNPILHANIPIVTSPVKIEYSLLTDSERTLLSPVMDGTFNSSTGTTNIESKNKNKDINKTGNISLAELQASANSQPTDVGSMLKNRTYSKKVRGILKEKGFNGKISEAEAWLKEHNMPISNIDDIDSWIDMLQNCR